MKKLCLALLVMIGLTSCCSVCKQRIKNARPLEGTEWHVVKFGGESVSMPEDTFNIILKDGKLSGVAACNRLIGEYSMTASKIGTGELKISSLGMTRMLCPTNEKYESIFSSILEGTTHYDIDYDMLMLMQNGVIKAVLKAK